MVFYKSVRTQRRPQHYQSVLRVWLVRLPHWFVVVAAQVFKALGSFPAPLSPCCQLAQVNPHSSMSFHRRGNGLESFESPCFGSGNVEVVQKAEHVFVWLQFSVRNNDGVVLRESKQGWHERVTLFATLSL